MTSPERVTQQRAMEAASKAQDVFDTAVAMSQNMGKEVLAVANRRKRGVQYIIGPTDSEKKDAFKKSTRCNKPPEPQPKPSEFHFESPLLPGVRAKIIKGPDGPTFLLNETPINPGTILRPNSRHHL